MTKFFNILTAFAALSLFTACSSDEVVEKNDSDNVIAFKASTANASRALSTSYWCNYSVPNTFDVHAEYSADGTNWVQYFESETYKYNSGKWLIEGDYRYWPKDGTWKMSLVSAYGANEGAKGPDNIKTYQKIQPTWNSTNSSGKKCASVVDFTLEGKAEEQVDLIYANTVVENTKPTNGVASMNFRHALSQICFKAKTETSHLYVEIKNVNLHNIYSKGTYNLPAYGVSTDGNKVDHGHTAAAPTTGIGEWVSLTRGINSFSSTAYTAGREGDTEVIELNRVDYSFNISDDSYTSSKHENYEHSFLVIPCKNLSVWAPGTSPSGSTNSYISLYCKIRNVSAYNSVVGDKIAVSPSDYYILGSKTGYATMIIPFPSNITWEQGKKYVYTIIFNKTEGGGYDTNGNKVLVPVKLDVTVDDFGSASDTNIKLENGTITTNP